MTDRELLEFAAKAAGYALKWGKVYMVGDGEIDCTDHPYVVSGQPDEADWYWDPLTDDGDALRLMVKLDMHLMSISGGEHEFVNVVSRGPGPEDFHDIYEDHNGDPCRATRRAIVRAASAIGKEMP